MYIYWDRLRHQYEGADTTYLLTALFSVSIKYLIIIIILLAEHKRLPPHGAEREDGLATTGPQARSSAPQSPG